MIESYGLLEDSNDVIESSFDDGSCSIDSLSPIESAYLDEVKDCPDAYLLRLEELGISQKDYGHNNQSELDYSRDGSTFEEDDLSTLENRQFAKEYKDVIDDRLCHNPFTKASERFNPDGSITFILSDPECININPNCEVTVKGNDIYASTGGWAEKGKEGLNGYIQEMPEKHYILDDGATRYHTDYQGRVSIAIMDYHKSKDLPERNGQRDSATERKVVEDKDGYIGKDDGGHLFSREIGGPNESINQVPMERDFQQHGEWREYERHEKAICDRAIANGHKVEITRDLEYIGDSKRPDIIKTRIIIDDVVIEKNTFVNPKPKSV